MYKKFKGLILSFFVSIILILSVGYADEYFEISKNLDIFVTLYKELNTFYVDDTDPGKLIKKGIDEMLKSLDPYTTYIPESEIEDFRFMTTGQYGGIGAIITKIGDYVYINEPYEGFPAQKAGLIAGDKILKINGNSAKGKSTEDISKILKGSPNTSVKILIERENTNKPLEFIFDREKVKIKSIPYYGFVNPGIGYIKLRSFTKNCNTEVREAFEELSKEQKLKGLIFDLRNNPGGLLNESVEVANLFLEKGEEIVSTRGKIKSWEKTYKAKREPIDVKTPIVVLINQASASASEIVSGAIQDLDRGVIIGQRSFGKGLVQQTRELSYNAKLKLTVAKYYIPSGRCIQAIDYSSRNKNGSLGKIPDSLLTKFSTKGGREVFDGGGIKPDILIEPAKASNIVISLTKERLFFNYATKYRFSNEKLNDKFILSDEEYTQFVNYLSDKEYSYITKTEQVLEKFKKESIEENYFDSLLVQYDALFDKLQKKKKDDLIKNKEQIIEILSEEISSRYFYQKGRIETSLMFDIEIKKAVDLFENLDKYNKILSAIEE